MWTNSLAGGGQGGDRRGERKVGLVVAQAGRGGSYGRENVYNAERWWKIERGLNGDKGDVGLSQEPEMEQRSAAEGGFPTSVSGKVSVGSSNDDPGR